METLKEGTKVTIDYNGGASGVIVGLGAQMVPDCSKMYIIKLIERIGQEWKDYEYSCVILPKSMFELS